MANNTGIYTASHRFARVSPRKARLVIDQIRFKPVAQALDVLALAEQKSGLLIDKVLKSAIANAQQSEENVKSLIVVEAAVNEGPRIKRFKAKDRGRAHPIIKPTAHIVVSVASTEPRQEEESA